MKCEWRRIPIGDVMVWKTSCNAQFMPMGPLKTVGFNYCPFCGEEIEETKS